MRTFLYVLPLLTIPLFVHAQASLTSLEDCYTNPAELISCGTREVSILFDTYDGAELMKMFQAELPEYMCHQFGHIVGRKLHENSTSLEEALGKCGGFGCSGACLHGATEGAFLEKLGIDPEQADPHIAEGAVFENAPQFCKDWTTCHGVGHMLFQLYNEFDVPLTVCKEVAEGFAREECYRGVFMDHAMKYSTYNVLLGEKKKQTYDSADILFPCNSVDEEYRHACYRYHPRLQAQLFDEIGIDDPHQQWRVQQNACETLEKPGRSACFEGFGLSFYGTVTSEPDIVHALSDGFSQQADRFSFTRGLVSYMVAHEKYKEASSYCSGRGFIERLRCYWDVTQTRYFIARM